MPTQPFVFVYEEAAKVVGFFKIIIIFGLDSHCKNQSEKAGIWHFIYTQLFQPVGALE